MVNGKEKIIDVVLDTDTYNEIDDQFAIAYLLRNDEKLRTKAIYAAPFLNEKADTPKEGMEKSFKEIHHILRLEQEPPRPIPVLKGAEHFLKDEKTPAVSEAAIDLAKRAMDYTPEEPLYVVGIAAATDIASAILLNSEIIPRIVVVWLGGSSFHEVGREEFNYMEDFYAVQVLFGSGVYLIQVPGWGVAEHFTISCPELEYYLLGKNPLSDYLARYTIEESEGWWPKKPWAKAIWDLPAVAVLLNQNERFMKTRIVKRPIPQKDSTYLFEETDETLEYVYEICREELFQDLFEKLNKGVEQDSRGSCPEEYNKTTDKGSMENCPEKER